MSFREFFEDSAKQLSSTRLVFICGSFIILGMALMQFFGLGSLATAIYGILSTLVSGGYMTAKYIDAHDNLTQEVQEQADAEIDQRL